MIAPQTCLILGSQPPPLTLEPPPILTSSMATTPSNFQSILDAALDDYHKHTGIDLTKHPSAAQLQNCHSPEDVTQLLQERESNFKDYREKYRKLIDCVRPVVKVIHALSGIFGEGAGLVSDQHYILLTSTYVYGSLQVPFQPTKVIFTGIDILLSVCIVLQLSCLCAISNHIRQLSASLQATMPLAISLNASQFSLDASIYIPKRSRHPLRCLISW